MVGTSDTTMNRKDFRKISDLVRQKYGINLTDSKKIMVETRLRKRLPETGCRSYSEYISFLFTEEGHRDELVHMVDAVSTNKTDFFREPRHFEYLSDRILPDWWVGRTDRLQKQEPFRVWSAACSTGEEPYTIAMILADFTLLHQNFMFQIFGSDISTSVLNHAAKAVYNLDQIDPVPVKLRNRYLRRGMGKFEGNVRIRPELRNSVRFEHVNLMNPSSVDPVYDVIFLRNVIIYFDYETKRRVLSKVLEKLRPGGYLFVGHSETLFDMNLPLRAVQPNVYRKPASVGGAA